MITTKFTHGFRNDDTNEIPRWIILAGQNSLYIYVLHYYLIQGLQPMLSVFHDIMYSSPCYFLPFYMFIAFGIKAISIAIAKVLNMNKFVGLVLFGR